MQTMEGKKLLGDYLNTQKLEKLMLDNPTGKNLPTYNIKRLMPDVKGRLFLIFLVALDITFERFLILERHRLLPVILLLNNFK